MSAARILVVDDESEIRGLLKEILADEGYEVDVAADASEARASRAQHDPDLVLLDIWMPDTDGITLLREWSQTNGSACPVVMMSGHGTVETAVEATRLGAFDFVEKPLSLAKLLRTVERALDSGRNKRQAGRSLVPPLIAPVGKSRAMQALREQVQQVAPHETPVLIVGEPGTGREAFARYIHSLSPRSPAPFVQLVATGHCMAPRMRTACTPACSSRPRAACCSSTASRTCPTRRRDCSWRRWRRSRSRVSAVQRR
jgi:two-component system, NtrC family, nitrogen regulation response regulator NtrX